MSAFSRPFSTRALTVSGLPQAGSPSKSARGPAKTAHVPPSCSAAPFISVARLSATPRIQSFSTVW
ncbi:hypothetical protein [Streptomyces sp. NPDC001037]|uniref:hypothetical protein n=1 Tax=Streptomyces sp. NPDC001037 TaxID=3364542 RepID=UPI0036754761